MINKIIFGILNLIFTIFIALLFAALIQVLFIEKTRTFADIKWLTFGLYLLVGITLERLTNLGYKTERAKQVD